MYQVMRAMINHSVPDIISQQEEEIKKLRKELREQTLWTDDLQHLLRQSADRQEREGDFLRAGLERCTVQTTNLRQLLFVWRLVLLLQQEGGYKI